MHVYSLNKTLRYPQATGANVTFASHMIGISSTAACLPLSPASHS